MPITPISIGANKQNLLALVQQACDEMGITSPSSIIGNSDVGVKQILALAKRECSEVATAASRLGGWEELRGEFTFNTAGVGSLTGTTTSGSAVITGISSTSSILAGYIISNASFPTLTSVVSVDSSTQVTMSAVATASTTSASMAFGKQSYTLPTDYGYFIPQSFWDRAYRWQMLGPLDAQEWQVLKSGISPTGPRSRFRVMGNLFYIDPIPTSVRQIVFEYYSNQWCQSAAGAGQVRWLADTDYYNLDDDLFILGLQWRYKQKKGLDYEQESNDWSMRLERLLSRNGGNRNLPMNATSDGMRLLNSNNVPDTGYGS